MPRMRAALAAVLCAAVVLIALAACEPKNAVKPPKENPDDPTLATVGGLAITEHFLKLSLTNVPIIFRGPFMTDEGKREFLERQIDAMVYYSEALRRQWDQDPEYLHKKQVIEKIALIYLAKKAAAQSLPPVTDEDVRAIYDKYHARAEAKGKAFPPFDEKAKSLRNSLERRRLNKAAAERVEALKKEYQVEEHPEILAAAPKDMPLNAELVKSRALNVSVRDYFVWVAGQPPEYKEQLKTAEGRQWLLSRHVEDELLSLDALAQQIHKSDDYKMRVDVASVNVLGSIAQSRITNSNIDATGAEAKEYFKKHPDEFKDMTWEQAEPQAREKATRDKRARIVKEFAFALRRDRYRVTYFEDSIKKLNLTDVTEGEIGLTVMPRPDKGAADVDIQEILSVDSPRADGQPDADDDSPTPDPSN